jgi:hypothetical protein
MKWDSRFRDIYRAPGLVKREMSDLVKRIFVYILEPPVWNPWHFFLLYLQFWLYGMQSCSWGSIRSIVLLVVLYGFETLPLRQGKKIGWGCWKRSWGRTEEGGVRGDFRKFRNEELHNFKSSPNIIWAITLRGREGRRIWYLGEEEKSIKGSGGKGKETAWKTWA